MSDTPSLYDWLGGMPGAEAVEDAPMPRWNWGAVGGPYKPS